MKFICQIDTYQTKYICTLEELCTLDIHFPDIQRHVDNDHVQDIINFQLAEVENKRPFCFIGDIILAKSSNIYFIIDGQHRYCAIRQLYLHCPSHIISLTILENIDYQRVFEIINKSRPVPEYIIKTTLELSKRSLLEEFRMEFCKEFKPYISKSDNPKRPNINIDKLLNTIHNIPHAFLTGHRLLLYFKYVNNNYLRDLDPLNSKKCIEKAHKCNSTPLFITNDIDNKWLTSVSWISSFNYTYRNTVTVDNDIFDRPKTQKLPKAIRAALWKKSFGTAACGTCHICKGEITVINYECGHIVSRYNGGSDTLNNLLPICSPCNKSIGKMNMGEFCKKYGL